MSPRSPLKSRIARALAAHARRVAAPHHEEWATAMVHEQEHLPPDASELSWALGCLWVSYNARLRAIARWSNLALLILFVFCLTPPCWNFIYILGTTPHEPLAGLLFGSATLIGPTALAAVLWTLSSPAHRPGKMFMVVLWALTIWALWMLRLPAQYPLLTHTTPEWYVFTIILNFVFLPALGVAVLQVLDARRRPDPI
jgi:hypothetical protein